MSGQQSKSNGELHEVAQERNDKQLGKVDKQTMTDLKLPMKDNDLDNQNDSEKVRKMDQLTMTDSPTCEYGGNEVDEQNEVRKVDQQTMTDLPTSEEQRNDKDAHDKVKINIIPVTGFIVGTI